MGIAGILFNPNGRIQANQFWQGIIVLVGVQIVIQVLTVYGPQALAPILQLISIAIIYPYICVYGKRLHDANKSAWMYLLFLLGYLILYTIGFFFIPGVGTFFTEYMELINANEAEAAQALIEQFTAQATIPVLISTIIINVLLGFIVARMFSYPDENEYGPPVGGVSAGSDNDDYL